MQEDPFLVENAARYLREAGEPDARSLRDRFRNLAKQHEYVDILLVDADGDAMLSLTGAGKRDRGYLPALAEAVSNRPAGIPRRLYCLYRKTVQATLYTTR